MSSDLSFLIELQKFDAAKTELVDEITDVQDQVKAQKAKIDALNQSLKTSKDQLTANQMKRKNLEMDASKKEDLIKKHQGELSNKNHPHQARRTPTPRDFGTHSNTDHLRQEVAEKLTNHERGL